METKIENDDMERNGDVLTRRSEQHQTILGKSYSDWAKLIGPRLQQILERHANVR